MLVNLTRVPRWTSSIQMSLPESVSIVTAIDRPSGENLGCAYAPRVSVSGVARPSRSTSISVR